MRFYVGSDHAAIDLRAAVRARLQELGHDVVAEVGPAAADDKVDYPDVAVQVARKVAAEDGAFGLLVCGTGQGMAMAANRVSGVRAAVCLDTFSAKMSRAHNDANVLCMGARVVGVGLAVEILDAFCGASFEGGRHQRRVDKIKAL